MEHLIAFFTLIDGWEPKPLILFTIISLAALAVAGVALHVVGLAIRNGKEKK